jgi:uncharacterized repeat protein (TIGR03803 family)
MKGIIVNLLRIFAFALVQCLGAISLVACGGGSSANQANQNQDVAQETVLHSFDASSADGIDPNGGVIQGADGNFYGTTQDGGTYGYGTFYTITPEGVETVLYSFGASIADGTEPSGGVRQGTDGNFYGTTYGGGAFNNDGTFFRITPAGAETVLYSFGASAADGTEPNGGVIQGTDGNFYGTTRNGGTFSGGTVYTVTPGGAEAVLYSFGISSTDGTKPSGGVIQGSDGNFYGTTYGGGAFNDGTVYKITPGGVQSVLYSFGVTYTDGQQPHGLIQGTDGNFYGTTAAGGTNTPNASPGNNYLGAGTFFKITPAGVETIVYSFGASITDGHTPNNLILGTDGNFYGTTGFGGTANIGSVFRITTAGTETVLYSFVVSNVGSMGASGVTQGTDGSLYGTTQYGGALNDGTVYKIKP